MPRSFNLRRTMLFMGPVLALLLTFVGMLVFHISSSTFAASSHTLFVNLTTVGSNTSCTSPGYSTVQSAVDAAHKGDTVYLCGTNPYLEQVIITKAITLKGDPGATIQAPAVFTTTATQLPPQFGTDSLALPQAIVIVWGKGSNANITNLNITGPLPGTGGCASEEYGVLVLAGGKVSLTGDHVTNIHDTNAALYGCQFGVGIQIGREYWPKADFSTFLVENFVGQATITKTTVTGYQKNGIDVDGPGSKGDITKSTVQGAGRDGVFSVAIAQNGMQISRGASGSIENNTIANNDYTNATVSNTSSAGIIIFGGCGDPLSKNIEIQGNVLSNNDVGIYLNSYTADPNCTAPATQKTNEEVTNNKISNDAITNVSPFTANGNNYTGYQAGVDDVGNNDVISHNTFSGVGYTPTQTTSGGPFIIPIDIITFPTIHPKISSNKIV